MVFERLQCGAPPPDIHSTHDVEDTRDKAAMHAVCAGEVLDRINRSFVH